MKRNILKIATLVLSLFIIVSTVCSCTSSGKTLLKYEKTELSENIFMLFLARLKGTMSKAENYSVDALADAFWDEIVTNGGMTREEQYKEKLLEECKMYTAALYLFDELGLKLPDSYMEDIEKNLDELVEKDADGSKTAFNALLSNYGANYNVLREAYIIEAKLSYLNEYLYGTNGNKIGNEVINEYYKANYVRFKHVFFRTFEIIYQTDSDGNDIYYTKDNDGRISYDTSAQKRRDKNGAEVKDKKGDVIYENADGTIAYDKENGMRMPKYDENGYVLTREFTKEELIAVSDHATLLMEELEGQEKNYTLFDSYVEELTEDRDDNDNVSYPNGFYMTAKSNYEAPQVLEAVLEMKAGEIRSVPSDYGIHIVMKYELEENGFGLTENSDFFINTKTGAYVFINDVMSVLLNERLKPYISKIEVDKSRFDSISIKDLAPDYYY